MTTVNFWDYATSEYCLDSFICYLLCLEEAKKAFFKLCGIDENEEIQSICQQALSEHKISLR